jgi:hypothetical protein
MHTGPSHEDDAEDDALVHRQLAHLTAVGHLIISGDPDYDVPAGMVQRAFTGYVDGFADSVEDAVPVLGMEYGVVGCQPPAI